MMKTNDFDKTVDVTPLAGVWIEINLKQTQKCLKTVTPLAGVWIEIYARDRRRWYIPSLPLRECGLK